MPRLNLRKNAGKSARAGDSMKVKVPSSKLTPLALKMQGKDDDISSDEEEDDVRKKGKKVEEEDEEEDDKYAYETAEEKRRRLAQQYLQGLSQLDSDNEAGSDNEGEDPYHSISEKLKRERLKAQGRLSVELGPRFETLSLEDDVTTSYFGGHQGSVTSLALPQDESCIITGSKDNAVFRYDTETGQRTILKRKWQRALDGDQQSHHGEILAVAISSDGKFVASGGRDRIIRIHDSRMEQSEIKSFTGHRDTISGLCFQSGTYSLFSSSYDRCVKYFDLGEMAYVETMFGHQDAILSIDCWHKLRPLTSSTDRTNRYWKVEDNAHLVFRGHKAPIDTARILTDSTFVSGSQDGKLCLWDHGKKTPISTVQQAHGLEDGVSSQSARWISSVASVKACDMVASGSYDGFVRLWSVSPETNKFRPVKAVPVAGFVNALHISSRLLVAGGGREHRLGRWWNLKGVKDRLTVMRFKEDLSSHLMHNATALTHPSQYVHKKNGRRQSDSMSEDEDDDEDDEDEDEDEDEED